MKRFLYNCKVLLFIVRHNLLVVDEDGNEMNIVGSRRVFEFDDGPVQRSPGTIPPLYAEEMKVPQLLKALGSEYQSSVESAYSLHCSIVAVAVDSGGDPERAHKQTRNFLEMYLGLDYKEFHWWTRMEVDGFGFMKRLEFDETDISACGPDLC